MNILFRVDAGGNIGLGHFFRSLNVADKLADRGLKVFFSHLKSDFWDHQVASGFKYPTIELDNDLWEKQTLEFAIEKEVNLYFADGSIIFCKKFVERLRKKVTIVFYQNMTETFKLADIVIDPSFEPVCTSSTVKSYSGLDYFIFHPYIENLNPKKIRSELSSIAVSAGGSDPSDTLLKLYKILRKSDFETLEITFYLGADYLYKDRIPKVTPENISFEPFDHNRILGKDVLVSAFGVSLYEFLYLGMPVISYGHKQRNAYVSDAFSNHTNAFLSMGNINAVTDEKIYAAIQKLTNYSTRKKFSDRGKALLDLNGAERVANIIESCLT